VDLALGILLMLSGIGMAFFWLSFMFTGGLSQGIRTMAGENYIILHITAEILTSVICLAGGLALALGFGWGLPVGIFACGMLAYTGINSLAWIKNTRAISLVFVTVFIISIAGGVYLLISYLN
jgi:hypothetical protein